MKLYDFCPPVQRVNQDDSNMMQRLAAHAGVAASGRSTHGAQGMGRANEVVRIVQ